MPNARAAEPCEPAVAEVVSAEGAVEIQREGETRWQGADLGDPLCLGDLVRTGRVSRAALVFANDSVLRLDQLTELRLRGVTEQQRSLLDVLAGAVQFFSRRPRALEIGTPFVTAAGEGTEFFVRVAEDRTRVIVFEGRVRAVNPEGELLLADGDAAIAMEGEAPRAEIIVRPRDAVAWALYYPPVLSALAERAPRPQALPMGLEQAVARVAANDYPGALDALDGVPEAARDVRYWTYRAGVLLNVGRVEEAQQAIEQALALDPDAAGALAQRAVILVVRQMKDQALADARRAVELEPDSAPARIALSYAHQARAELEPARAVLREAVARAPDDALAWARLAEIELSFGNLDPAEDAAERAAALAPELGRTQMVLGFAELVRIDIDAAKAAFEQAIALDSANPLARLGLGLARIRKSDLDEGRREIEIAAGLDPGNALVRSYLGKAYFEETREAKAATQFQIAKQLDPNDPTPYFYDAIRKQLANRPVEALRDLETAIDLNDNRAVYRSRLLLDQDLATRSVSLARIYDDLGFDQVAFAEATKSLTLDPSSHSAHRFLSDSVARRQRHEITRVSELLQAQLLQPVNLNPVQPRLAVTDLNIVAGTGPAEGAFKEYTPLFERNRAQLTATGLVGNNDTLGDEVVASGLWNRLSFSVGQFHTDTDGFRDNNDLQHDLYDVFAQAQLSPKVNIQTEYIGRETAQGDLSFDFDRSAFSQVDRRTLDQDVARFGLRVTPNPHIDFLGSFIYGDRKEDQRIATGGPRLDVSSDTEAYDLQGQYLQVGPGFDVLAGGGYARIDSDELTVADFSPPSGVPCPIPPLAPSCKAETPEDEETEQRYGYAYLNLDLPAGFVPTFGLSFDSFDADTFSVDRFNPKLGVQWWPTEHVRLRAAYVRVVKRELIVDRTLEPTQVAGFNQFFDDGNGTRSERYGTGVDARLRRGLYTGLELSRRELEVPTTEVGGTTEFDDFSEQLHYAYVYWTPHERWASAFDLEYERFKQDDPPDDEINDVPIKVRTFVGELSNGYFHPSGFFGQLDLTYLRQHVDRLEGSDLDEGTDHAVLVDVAVGYRLPRRRGIMSFEVRNVFDQTFRFQDGDFQTAEARMPRFLPARTWLARLTLSF